MFKILTQNFSLEDFLACLTNDNSTRDRDYVWQQWETEKNEGAVGFKIIINGQAVFGGIKPGAAVPHRSFIRHFNNELVSLLKTGVGEITIHRGSGVRNDLKDIKLILKQIDDQVAFNVNRHDCEGSYAGLNILNGQQREPLILVIEEYLKLKHQYRKIYEDGLRDLVPAKDYERMMSLTFKQVEVLRGYGYDDWLPLEQAWSDYKKQRNITDEDVKQAITDEEEKERKMEKKWWEVWK